MRACSGHLTLQLLRCCMLPRACVALPCALPPCGQPCTEPPTACCALPLLLLLLLLSPCCPAAAETQDAEQAQACLLVTLVVLAKGTVKLPAEPLRDQQAFKESMKSVSHTGGAWGIGMKQQMLMQIAQWVTAFAHRALHARTVLWIASRCKRCAASQQQATYTCASPVHTSCTQSATSLSPSAQLLCFAFSAPCSASSTHCSCVAT